MTPHKPIDPGRFVWGIHAEAELHTTFTVIAEGKRIPVFVASDKLARCDHCISRQGRIRVAHSACPELPECGGLVFLLDTPENRAAYTAALITGKWMP